MGSLTDSSEIKFRYSYHKRGCEENCLPELFAEADASNSYGEKGRLVHEKVGFDGPSLLNSAVDIHFSFEKTCFIDSVSFNQYDDSEIGKIEVLTNDFKPVGVYEPETDKTIKEDRISVSVGMTLDSFILRLHGDYQHIIIGNLDILGGFDIEKAVYPIPVSFNESGKFFTAVGGITASGDALFPAENFKEKYFERFGKKLSIGSGAILFEIADMEKESFTISVTEKSVSVRGGSRRALLYASEKLLQLCSECGIRTAEISDAPFFGIRGAHFALPNKKDIPFLKRMVKYVLMPLGYNTLFMQVSGAFEYKKHPEINKVWHDACEKYDSGSYPKPPHYPYVGKDIYTHEEISELCAYFRLYGFEIVPEVQSYGHTQYITMAYPELAEVDPDKKKKSVDLYNADARPSEFYHHCMCSKHPKYYDITFDIIDEVIDVVRPECFVHIGHDEIYTMGKCPRCRDIPVEKLYADEVTALHDHIKEKGLKTMMWSDMIEEAELYETAKAIDDIPKDIVCLSFTWYFHLKETKNVEERLYEHGFDVVMGNLYSSHYPRFDTRRLNKSLLGGEVSTWVPCTEPDYGFEGKIYDFIYTSNMMWNKSYRSDLRNTYDAIIEPIIETSRPFIRGESIIASKKYSLPLAKEKAALPLDISSQYDGAIRVCNGEAYEIDADTFAKRICFLHATDKSGNRTPWKAPELVGEYIIAYADGDKAYIEILYAANIHEYKRKYAKPALSALFRHEGYMATYLSSPHKKKTCDGKDYTLYEYAWANPTPEKKIKSIKVRRTSSGDEAILLFDISVEN